MESEKDKIYKITEDIWNALNDSVKRNISLILEDKRGDKYWVKEGKLHRDNGPAVEFDNGDKEWWVKGQLHREDGPAIDNACIKYWYKEGKAHREDGPAIEWLNGDKEWYERGKFIKRENLK